MSQDNRRGPQAEYEAFLEQGRFMLQRSRSTGEHVFWPRVVAASGATDLEWVEASGDGTVHAITVNRKREGSHNVALIDLAEGPRMMSTLPAVETVPIGTRVRARIEPGETPRVVFDPV
ncbi:MULTISPECIES: Zn-ribbon domain-containing OB-fold protein [unclassified Paracoccus (in: a-proteobacteria)]|uniref:Zn-ribbon domain-containing OB-fold protein n=1 Tax=unclassified Paracoccus (in: a-proteobacteria) TaxID=2688777 RepID=UPI0015FFCBAB|nr:MULTISPECIES: OB-fold domain-containing protein [unclassified Paracoccus (in: a-proteobacteria)]MBB1492846.1 OB-fold domain-containing protein [Paracoccus sp. MC1854]MBB1499495.1 OB-fold domain-containing protein [Paracoccus sp. MC1862]QQO45807.1 OB-fold domain-containing protein [Paracoccus sp. MC1862]